MKISTALSETMCGRIVLHLGCLLRRPEHATWHWHGIARELSFGLTLLLGRARHGLTVAAAFLVFVSASVLVVFNPNSEIASD